MTTTTAAPHDPALEIGRLTLNDCRTVCRALKLRAAELRKLAKKAKDLDRHTEASSIEHGAQDIAERLGPRFDEQGTFAFLPAKKQQQPRDEAEAARERVPRGAR